MRRLFSILVFASVSAPLLAQQAAPPATPAASTPPAIQRPGAAPPGVQRPTTAPPAQQAIPPPGIQTPRPTPGQSPAVATPPQAPGQQSWQNIKLEVTIADSLTADSSTRKTVSMLIADGRNGQVRSQGGVDGVINIEIGRASCRVRWEE